MINNNKVAYIIHSDMEKINPNVDYLMLDYDATLSGQPGQYFFVHINNSDMEALPIKIAANWYRNEEGKDFIENDFSIGVSIDRRVRFLGANIIKYYMAFKHWAEEYDQIILEPNMPEIIYEIAKIFKGKISLDKAIPSIYLKGKSHNSNVNLYFKGRAHIKPIPTKKRSAMLYLFQDILNIDKQNRVLCFPDWTYDSVIPGNFLVLNSKNPKKGFYFKKTDTQINPIELNEEIISLIKHRVNAIIKGSNVNDDDKNNLVILFVDMILKEYNKSKNILFQIYYTIVDLFDNYKPCRVVLPNMIYCWYSMVLQVARKKHIKTIVVTDGYLTFDEDNYFQKDHSGKKYIVDEYAAMGDYNIDILSKYSESVHLQNISTPLSHHNKYKPNVKKKYDALIMMPYPWLSSINGLWDSRHRFIHEVEMLLEELSIKSIAIKVKTGRDKMEVNSIKSYSQKDIISGHFHDIANQCKIVIGTLGTGTIESSLSDIPYYLYEPYYNGLSSKSISSSFVNKEYFARDINSLSSNIINHNSVSLSSDKILNGANLKNIFGEYL